MTNQTTLNKAGNRYLHDGIDLSTYGKKSPLYATADGIVISIGKNDRHPNGKFLKIQHSDGYSSFYAHMSKIIVSEGQRVAQGQQIGNVGNTGVVRGKTGIHVHFTIEKNGIPVDPELYINNPDIHLTTTQPLTASVSPASQYYSIKQLEENIARLTREILEARTITSTIEIITDTTAKAETDTIQATDSTSTIEADTVTTVIMNIDVDSVFAEAKSQMDSIAVGIQTAQEKIDSLSTMFNDVTLLGEDTVPVIEMETEYKKANSLSVTITDKISKEGFRWPVPAHVKISYKLDANVLDITQSEKDILATKNGTVIVANEDEKWGKFVVVCHDAENGIYSWYTFLDKIFVQELDNVLAGQIIAQANKFKFLINKGRDNPLNYLPKPEK